MNQDEKMVETPETYTVATPANGASSNGAAVAVPVQRLAVLDKPFESSGVAEVKVTRGGKETILAIPIRAVAYEDVERLVKHARPLVPKMREYIKEKRQYHMVVNEVDDDYQGKLGDYNRLLSKVWVLMSLDVDVYDRDETLVWSRDNSVCDIHKAIQALHDMGLVDPQLTTIFKAAQALTQSEEEEQVED